MLPEPEKPGKKNGVLPENGLGAFVLVEVLPVPDPAPCGHCQSPIAENAHSLCAFAMFEKMFVESNRKNTKKSV